MQNFKTEGVYLALANLVTDWNTLNQTAKDAYVYECIKGLVEKDFYELPDDITTTGNRYFVELMDVGLVKIGA